LQEFMNKMLDRAYIKASKQKSKSMVVLEI